MVATEGGTNGASPLTDQCPGISTTELMQRTGITMRQANYWCLTGYIKPHNHKGRENGNPGSGYRRCWLPVEVAKVENFQELLDLGIGHEEAWWLLEDPQRIAALVANLAGIYYRLTVPHLVDKSVDEEAQ